MIDGNYLFIGSVVNRSKSGKFTTSVYRNVKGDRHFCHVLHNDIITTMEEVILDSELNLISKPIPTDIGGSPVFAYTDENNHLYCDFPEQFEMTLMELLYKDEIKPASKLVISSFLNLHGKTYDLVREKQHLLNEKGIRLTLDMDDFVSTDKPDSNEEINFKTLLTHRYETYKSAFPALAMDDLALFSKNELHVGFVKVGIDDFLKKQKVHKTELTHLINSSIEKQRITKDSLDSNERFYLFVLDNVNVTENRFNTVLSMTDTEEPVLNIAMKVEKYMSKLNKRKRKITDHIQQNVNEIYDDIEEIMQFHKK